MVHVVSEPRLAESYRTCRRLQRRHDPTYYCATRFLPRDVQPAVHALYGFVRGADQIVDGPGRLPPGPARRAALDAWQAELERGLACGHSEHPIIAALVDAGPRHGLPLHLLPRYMDSMRVDCDEPVRIASRAQLDEYMEGSAATVGRVIAPLLGAPEPEAVARLGVAFQLTNFIRDVPVDWDLDRVYLPGLPEDDLRAGASSDSLRERIAQEAGRARELFAETAGVALAPGMRRGVRMARAVYARVLDRVEANGYDVLEARARLRPWRPARGARAMTAAGSADVLVCGASFAGLAVARELAGAGADVLVVDRYEIGARATSACAAPTPWLHAMGVAGAIRRELPAMTLTTPHGTVRYRLPWSWSAFDYRELCELLWAQCGDARFERATVERARGRGGRQRPRAAVGAAVVDAMGWRRVLTGLIQPPPDAPLSRGLEVHPHAQGDGEPSTSGSSARSCAVATAGACRPAPRRASAWAPTIPISTCAGPPTPLPPASTPRPCATRATGSRTACARPPTATCSTWATAPGIASRSRARASAPRSTASRPGASCAPCSPATSRASARSPITPRSTMRTRPPSAARCTCNG